jgi:hypothetical protein
MAVVDLTSRNKDGVPFTPICVYLMVIILCLLQLKYTTIVDEFKIHTEFYIGEF